MILKRVLLRESIIFVSTVLFCVAVSCIIYFYFNYQTKELAVEKLKLEISIAEKKAENNRLDITSLKLWNLYNGLDSRGYDTPRNFDSFIFTLSSELESRKTFHSYLVSINYFGISSDFDEFNLEYFSLSGATSLEEIHFRMTHLKREIEAEELKLKDLITKNYNSDKPITLFCIVTLGIVFPIRWLYLGTRWMLLQHGKS